MYLFELGRERDWLAPDRAGARTPFVKHLLMIWEPRNSIIDARVPQDPALSVVDEVTVSGKADGSSDVDSGCPMRFVGAGAVAAIDYVETVYSRLGLRVGRGGNSSARRGYCQR